LLFFGKLSTADILFLAEILGHRRFSEQKNSEVPAVLLLFSAVSRKHVHRLTRYWSVS